MRILAVNGSPMMKRGMTHALAEKFLEGVRQAGAEVENVFLQQRRIAGCIGCYRCWVKTPGKCIQRDDMGELLQAVRGADFLVISSPVYLDGVTAQTKLFIDRMIPLLDPHFRLVDSHVRHSPRHPKLPGIALLSVAGFPEMDNFEPLVSHMERLARNLHTTFVGWLGRPMAYVLSLAAKFPEPIGAIEQAARLAGRELVEKGEISKASRDAVARPVFPVEGFVKQSNLYWDQCIEAGRWPAEPPPKTSTTETKGGIP